MCEKPCHANKTKCSHSQPNPTNPSKTVRWRQGVVDARADAETDDAAKPLVLERRNQSIVMMKMKRSWSIVLKVIGRAWCGLGGRIGGYDGQAHCLCRAQCPRTSVRGHVSAFLFRVVALDVPPARLVLGQLHVNHGTREAVVVAKRHDAVVEVLHDAALGKVKLLVRPEVAAPDAAVVLRRLLGVLGELDGDDERGEDDEGWVDRVDV